jgi:hypothetical protein
MNGVACNSEQGLLRVLIEAWDTIPNAFEYTVSSGYETLLAEVRLSRWHGYTVTAESANFEELRVAGVTAIMGEDFWMKDAFQARGTFAATWSKPNLGDVDCEDCVEIRVRGTFQGTWRQ